MQGNFDICAGFDGSCVDIPVFCRVRWINTEISVSMPVLMGRSCMIILVFEPVSMGHVWEFRYLSRF